MNKFGEWNVLNKVERVSNKSWKILATHKRILKQEYTGHTNYREISQWVGLIHKIRDDTFRSFGML